MKKLILASLIFAVACPKKEQSLEVERSYPEILEIEDEDLDELPEAEDTGAIENY